MVNSFQNVMTYLQRLFISAATMLQRILHIRKIIEIENTSFIEEMHSTKTWQKRGKLVINVLNIIRNEWNRKDGNDVLIIHFYSKKHSTGYYL